MPSQSGYAVGWVALALINAGLAQGKGQSGLIWFVISLLLGPLATLLVVLRRLEEDPKALVEVRLSVKRRRHRHPPSSLDAVRDV